MEWNDKIEMAKLLNSGNYSEAVKFIKDKEMDAQAMDMFITGFDLSQWKLLEPIKSLILSYDSGALDFRSALRMELAKEKNTKEFVKHSNVSKIGKNCRV